MSYFNRKRRFDYNDNEGGPMGGGRPQYNKRFHNNRNTYQSKFSQLSPIEKTTINVCKDINKIGEDCEFADLLKNLNHISIPIAVEFNKEDYFRNSCLMTIYTTLIEQPHKILLLSCLVQIANAKNQSIGKFVVEFFHQTCLDLISSAVVGNNDETAAELEKKSNDTGPWNKLKLVLRLFATLTTIIDKDSVLRIYAQCLNTAIDLQDKYGDKRCPLAEALYYNTLISVPFLLVFGQGENDQETQDFISKIKTNLLEVAEKFKIADSKSIELIKPFYLTAKGTEENQGDAATLPYEPKLLISTLLPAVQKVAEGNFDIVLGKLFPDFNRMSLEMISESLAGQELGTNSLPQLSFPSVDILVKVAGLDKGIGKIDSLWRTPRLLFEVFPPNAEFETMPNVSTYEGLLFKDLTQDVIEALEYNKKLGSKQLLSLDFYFKPKLFVPTNKSLQELTIINDFNKTVEHEAQKNSTWAIEDIVVENVLSLIFQLPNAQTLPMYYYNVLVEACEKAPVGMAPRFGKAMRFFYNNISVLDSELRLRFMDWMSMQLSNFQFKWKWNEWKNDSIALDQSVYHPKKLFIKNLIFKEIRLATKERIYDSFGNDVDEFGKYLNIAILNTVDKLNKYDESVYGADNNVVNENTAKELVVDKTIDQPGLKFVEHQSMPFFQEANDFLVLIQQRAAGTEAEFWDFIQKFDNKLNNMEDEQLARIPNKERFKLNFLFQIICFATSRSISHFETFISKVLFRIKKIVGLPIESFEILKHEDLESSGFNYEEFYQTNHTPIEDKAVLLRKELYIIEAVLRYWNDTPQNGFIILDILTRLGLLSKEAIFEYIFGGNSEGEDSGDEECQVLSNALATEIFLKHLGKIANAKDNTYVSQNFLSVAKKFTGLLNDVIGRLRRLDKLEDKIESPAAVTTIDDSNKTEYDLRWKYVAAMGLLKSVFRKFSDEFQFLKNSVAEIVQQEVFHEDTKQSVLLWLDQLSDL